MAKRVKQDAAPFPAAQNKDQVNEMIAEIGRLQRERERIRADMNDEMAQVKELYEAEAIPLGETIRALSSGVQTWCEANRSQLTGGGKVKHAMLAAGKINWRVRPPKVSLRGVAKVLEYLKKAGLNQFVRVKEEVDKTAMLGDPETAATVPGVTISQGEDFVITPHESELEEVAA